MTAGPPKSSPQCGCLGPVGDELGWQGTRAWMTSSSTIHVSAGYSWIAILLHKLRLGLLLVFGIVVLMMGANSAFAQTQQTCAIFTGGNVGAGTGVSPTYLANQDGRANQG